MKKDNILVLCTGNSARSQMAEAYLRESAGETFDVCSAGLDPKDVHPLAKVVMREDGVSIEHQRSKGVEEFLGKFAFRYVIIVCAKAEQNCPSLFPGALNRLFWPFEDPAAHEGTDEEKLGKFRDVRDQIKSRIRKFVQEKI